MWIKSTSFNVWVRYCVRNWHLWNSTQNILPIHWKIWFLFNTEILRALRFKSSYAFLKRPPDPYAYMRSTWHYLLLVPHHWIGSALIQIMACRLFGAKPLSKPKLGYCQLNLWFFYLNTKPFIHENASENIVCEMSAMGWWVKNNESMSPNHQYNARQYILRALRRRYIFGSLGINQPDCKGSLSWSYERNMYVSVNCSSTCCSLWVSKTIVNPRKATPLCTF